MLGMDTSPAPIPPITSPFTDSAVQITYCGAVTTITLNRPDVRNAVDSATAQALYQAFIAFENDVNAKVAVFHGVHGHFCAGWDLKSGAQMLAQPNVDEHELLSNLNSHLNFKGDEARPGPPGPMGPSRLQLAKPVIAAISGAAVAGGMELALWCDLRVMESDAYFGVYCRRFGVPLIDGGTVRLPRLIGMGHAMDLILTGRKVEAVEALRIGLCNRVVPPGAALVAALQLAQDLCQFPQATMLADRQSAYAQWDLPLPQALYQEWERGKQCIAEGLQGATRFAAGSGRHGVF
jgi:enoyl-CoA hydratase